MKITLFVAVYEMMQCVKGNSHLPHPGTSLHELYVCVNLSIVYRHTMEVYYTPMVIPSPKYLTLYSLATLSDGRLSE